MPIQPWNTVFLVAFAAYVVIRGIFEERTRSKKKLLTRAGRLEFALMVLVFMGSLLLPVLYLFTPWVAFADYHVPDFFPWCGVITMMAALGLFWRSHADLGPNWSRTLELRQGHCLVKQGVYKTVRHPMYAAIWLFCLGQGLLLQNWFAGWSAFVTFGILYIIRLPREEAMMCDFFGQEYRQYMTQTGRLFPRLHRKK